MESLRKNGVEQVYKSFHYWLIENIEVGSKILELGSGPGTNILLEHFDVTSVEHDHNWVAHTKSNYIHAPIMKYDGYKWYHIGILEERLPTDYKALIVDGPTGKIGRIGFLHNLDLFNLTVPIIIDDVNRKPERNLLEKLSEILGEYTIFEQEDKKFAII